MNNNQISKLEEVYGLSWEELKRIMGIQNEFLLNEFQAENIYKNVCSKVRRILCFPQGTPDSVILDAERPVDYLESKNYFNPISIIKPSIDTINNSRQRMGIHLRDHHLETSSIKRNICVFQNQEAAQRGDLFLHQLGNSTSPIFAELPIVESQLAQDILCSSTCIRKLQGNKIKIIKKIKSDRNTIYLYELDDIVYYYQHTGTIDINGYATRSLTDLDSLEVGVEYEINTNSTDAFYLEYPEQFNPIHNTLAVGVNVRAMLNIDINNADDSAKVSESFVRKTLSYRVKYINIHLNKKKILSKYPNLFPEVGTIIKEPILCRLVQDIGPISELALNVNSSTGYEEETIYVEPNSFITSIEVYSNSPITDPKLEELRQKTLNIRQELYHDLSLMPDNKLSNYARIIRENTLYNVFRTDSKAMDYTYIRIKVVSIDIPEEGSKFSNYYGGKFTIQNIYKDGTYKDEFGNNIDLIYPSTAIISRNIPGILNDMQLTAYSLQLKYAIKNNLITKEKLYELIQKVTTILNLHHEWAYANLTVDELWELLNSEYLKWIILPYSADLTQSKGLQVLKLFEEYISFRKSKIYEISGKTVRCLTDRHQVSFMHVIIDKHVPLVENSVCDIPIKDTKGYTQEKNSDRRDSRAIVNRQPMKIDIQGITNLILMLSNESAHVLLNADGDVLYAIGEQMAGQGSEFYFTNTHPQDEEDDI